MKQNTITLEDAQRWAARWNADQSNVKADLKAFLVPGYNVIEVMKEPNVVDVRTYFGINDNDQATLIIVGVDCYGNDLIGQENNIFDFSKPCPASCTVMGPFINPCLI